MGRILLLAACVACSLAAPALAQSKRADSADYQKLVQQALHEYELGNFSEAKSFFAQAHALSPNARTLRGLGMSAYELRNYVEAIGYFDQALNSPDRPLTVPMRGEVSQLLKQARGFVTRLRVKLEPASAELRIDTRPVSKDAAGFVMLDPGAHELVAEARDYEPATRTIRTDGGEELTVGITLHAAGQAKDEAAVEAPAPLAATEPTKQAARQATSSVGPWILIGVSAAVTIAGGVLLALTVSDMNKVEKAPPGSAYVTGGYKDAYDRVLPMSVAGFSALGVGVAGLVGGVVWKVASTGGPEETAGAKLDLLPGEIRLHGRF
jgi:tetratricopeptide (TPR) repeat protein